MARQLVRFEMSTLRANNRVKSAAAPQDAIVDSQRELKLLDLCLKAMGIAGIPGRWPQPGDAPHQKSLNGRISTSRRYLAIIEASAAGRKRSLATRKPTSTRRSAGPKR